MGSRERLIEVLLASVAERGIEGASVRTVAARAGVSIGAVQHHFPTKDAMLLDAYREVGERIGARAEASADATSTPKAALRSVLLELLPLDERSTAELRVSTAFAAHSLGSERLATVLREDLVELEQLVTQICAYAGAADPALEARLALAVTAGLAEPLLFGDGSPDAAVTALDAHLDRAFPT